MHKTQISLKTSKKEKKKKEEVNLDSKTKRIQTLLELTHGE